MESLYRHMAIIPTFLAGCELALPDTMFRTFSIADCSADGGCEWRAFDLVLTAGLLGAATVRDRCERRAEISNGSDSVRGVARRSRTAGRGCPIASYAVASFFIATLAQRKERGRAMAPVGPERRAAPLADAPQPIY
jgi:hypothetical protein